MRVESLRYFLEIAQLGSYSRASRKLYVSQQGLGKSVHALERELGVVLFERSGRRVHLTEAGRELAPLARECVEADERLREAMRRFARRDEPVPPVRLLATPFVSTALFTLMKSRLEQWDLRDPLLEEGSFEAVSAFVGTPGEPVLALVTAGSRQREWLAGQPDAAFEPLVESEIGVLGTVELLSPRKRVLARAEAAKLPYAIYGEPFLEEMAAGLFPGGAPEHVMVRTTNLGLIYELVDAGRAVMMWDSLSGFLDEEAGSRMFVPVEGAPSFTVGFLHSRQRGLGDEQRRYAERFARCVAQTCAPYVARHALPAADGADARP